MSPPSFGNQRGGPYRKPRADVYTVLLILALIAILLGILCLHFEMKMYDYEFRGAINVPADHPIAVALASNQRPGTGDQGPVVGGRLTVSFPLVPDR